MKSHIALLMVGLLISISSFNQSKFVKPEDFFGFAPGSDRNLFNYEKLIEYLKIADASSDRLEISQVGYSPTGKPMYIAFISSLANIAQLDELREINKELTINPELSVKEQENLVQQGRVFLMATLSMHSSEVGHAQSAPLTVSDLCNTTDPLKLEWMDNVVYMMIPNHNPDGMNMVVDYFLETKGAKYEGASQPGVYHKTSVPN